MYMKSTVMTTQREISASACACHWDLPLQPERQSDGCFVRSRNIKNNMGDCLMGDSAKSPFCCGVGGESLRCCCRRRLSTNLIIHLSRTSLLLSIHVMSLICCLQTTPIARKSRNKQKTGKRAA
jgi:hypothetical protein